MRTLTVQAYEDHSRPEGGHAVIVVHGLDAGEGRLSFRLRPLDAGRNADSEAAWLDSGKSIEQRKTSDGVELLIGPEIADSEQLLPGTVVEIEFPQARARGEFLWPNVAPLLRPRRRSIVVRGGKRGGEVRSERASAESARLTEAATSDDGASAVAPAHGEASNETAAGVDTGVDTDVHSGAHAGDEPPRSDSPAAAAPAPAPAAGPIGTASPAASGDAATTHHGVAAEELPPAARPSAPPARPPAAAAPITTAPITTVPVATAHERPDVADGAVAASGRGGPHEDAAATAHITAGESWYESARGSHRVASEPAASRRPQSGPTSMAATAGILLATLAAVYMLSREPAGRHPETAAAGPGIAAAPAGVPAGVIAHSPTASPPPAPLPTAAATPGPGGSPGSPGGSPGAPAQPGGGISLFEVLATGTTSPRGINANGVDAAKALENANAQLQGPGRDVEEGSFWLRRFLQSNLSDERTMRVLTQLGSTYAEPQGRSPDYVKARLLWEIASAAGDPVAMCFLGLVHENGLGTTRDKKTALQWYERSKTAGGCPHVEDAIARVKP